MKLSRTKMILTAALALAGGFYTGAQSNSTPADTNYAQFSQFITERNIFDPNRYPRNRTGNTRVRTRTRARTVGAPYVTLVGTMSYEKGLFAFFDSNNPDMKKILTTDDEVAGYKVKEITTGTVTLEGADKKEFLMKVGEQMRQESGTWQLNGQAEADSSAAATEAPVESDSPADATEAPAAAPSSDLQANEVLKRLMKLREQENQ